MYSTENNCPLQRQSHESEYQYIWRIASAMEAGIIDKTWVELAELFNAELHEDDPRTEAAYRKPFSGGKLYFEHVFSKQFLDNDIVKKIQAEKYELYKVKRQVSDQRRELNRILTRSARADHLADTLAESIARLNESKPLYFETTGGKASNDREAVLFFADWHYGMTTRNIWNEYSAEICRRRVRELVEKASRHIRQQGVSKLHVVLLGDAAHGSIHTSCRVASEENTVDQLTHVAELIAEAVAELSKVVDSVEIHSTYGNHLRSIQNKHDSIHADNMEKIIPWWLRERLKEHVGITVHDSEFYEFIKLKIAGRNLVCTHGDLDRIKSIGQVVNAIFMRQYGEAIDYTVSADKHHLEEFESLGIESVLVRSLCGTDDYANEHRLYSSPGQTLMIFSAEEGRECTYNIKVD